MPARRRCVEQRAGFGRVACERLLAQDVLAGANRLEDERGVGVRWRRDRDCVDAGERQRLGH